MSTTSTSPALAAWVQARPFVADKGVNPSIASNIHDTALALYAQQDPDDDAYYVYYCLVGHAGDGSISWGSKIQVARVSNGPDPLFRVALNDHHLCIIVFDSESKLYAVGGRVDPATKTVSFGDTNQWDSGLNPAIALNNSNIAVEVHQGNGNSQRVYYSVGSIDPATKWVSFNDSKHYDSGQRPNVALNNANVVLEVHETTAMTLSLWCTVGTIQDDREHIDFGAPQDYDNGMRPSVALNDANETLEVHWASMVSVALWSHAGTIDPTAKTAAWNTSWNYDHGGFAACAMNNRRAVVEVHRTSELGDTLGSRVGRYIPS